MTDSLGWDREALASNASEMFKAGSTEDRVPAGDTARQAVHALGGYAYQVLSTALAWLDMEDNGRLFLEVAEDYATVAQSALEVNQVKYTNRPATVTLRDQGVRDAIAAYVGLVQQNPRHQVTLRFLTTSNIGTERAVDDRPSGQPGLLQWRRVASGACLTPFRGILEGELFTDAVQEFCKARNDDELRSDLFSRIHWDCGRPDITVLQQELQDRLIVLCRGKVAAPDARQLLSPIAYRVLEKCIAESPDDRVLTSADLYDIIDTHTRTSVPNLFFDYVLEEILNRLPSPPSPGDLKTGRVVTISERDWLIDGTTLPAPRTMVPRETVQSTASHALAEYGASVLYGSSGLGKSVVCRAVANLRDAFFVVEFRHFDANETRSRLDLLFAHVGGLPPSALILEDLNQIDVYEVMRALARVIEAARRHDHTLLLTCYEKPSVATLTAVGLDSGCAIECPYFEKEEVHEFVRLYGGVAEKWGDIAYAAGAFGHPQLTHAFVAEMATRQWPSDEIGVILRRGLSSDDVDATRKAARRRLPGTLPDGARDLLYRLSLTTGHFSRIIAIAIGTIPQPVPRAGECMDLLTGPWIESVGNDAFRVSPLARDFGRNMLPADEQRRIHETFAEQMLAGGNIVANDANTIMAHAIAGRSVPCLVILARSVLSADSRTLTVLADHFLLLRFFRTDVPIYPDDLFASIVLRIAQFKVTVSASEDNNTTAVVTALFDEIANLREGERKRAVKEIALFTVLNTIGIANHVEDWVSLLLQLKTKLETYTGTSQGPLANSLRSSDMDIVSVFFDVGSTGIATVDRLEHVITQLDEIDTSERTSWLKPINNDYSDYSVFINGPWVAQQRAGCLRSADAVKCYRRMEEKTRSWGFRVLTLQCVIAQATILDECQNDSVAAAKVIQRAVVALDDDPILQRAMVKVLRGRGEHRKALEVFRSIEDGIGNGHPVMRAFALREAAISAAKCNDWSQAERWFLDARDAARRSQGDNIAVMAIGLGADSAVAAIQTGDVAGALFRLAEALEALTGINPETTLQRAYCHRSVRVVVLWARSHIEDTTGGPVKVSEHLEAGLCSNPTPSPEVRRIPLVHLDVSRYILAIAETAAGVDAGITAELSGRLKSGPIRYFEAELGIQQIRTDIDRLNATGFADHFMKYLESAVFLSKNDHQSRETLNRLILERGSLPTVQHTHAADPALERAAVDAITSYIICASLAENSMAISNLITAFSDLFDGVFPGNTILDSWNDISVPIGKLEHTVLQYSKSALKDLLLTPDDFWIAGLRLFEWSNQSYFKRILIAHIASWMRAGWQRILTTQKFLLIRPGLTVPAIRQVLDMPDSDRAFVAKLILTTEQAVGHALESSYLDRLRAMSDE